MELTKEQQKLLRRILKMPRGTVFTRPHNVRILWGFGLDKVYFKGVKLGRSTRSMYIYDFVIWAEKADIKRPRKREGDKQ